MFNDFRERISLQFAAAKPDLKAKNEAEGENSVRLDGKRAALSARLKTLVYALEEPDVDSWIAKMDEAEEKRFSARLTTIHGWLKTNRLIERKA